MPKSDDPAKLTPDQRLTELAEILAKGILRLREREIPAPISGKPPDKKARKTLD